MMLRIVEVGTRSSSGPTTGRMAGVAAAARAGAPPLGADSTSARTMRPPGPVPSRWLKSTPSSSATLRASGEAFTRTPLAAAARAAGRRLAPGAFGNRLEPVVRLLAVSDFSVAFSAAAGAGAALASKASKSAGAASPSSSSTAIAPPNGILSPAFTTSLCSTPSKNEVISIVALSVSTSAMG